jgi:hypothetical protein
MNPDVKDQPIGHNLLTDFDRTLALIDEVEGAAYKETRLVNIREAIEYLKQVRETTSNLSADECVTTFTGDGSTRWNLMASGELRFSGFHDQAMGDKTKKAEELGFKLF